MRKLYILYLLLCFYLSAKAQSPGAVFDVQHYNFNIQLSDSTNLIKGEADISVRFLKSVSSVGIGLVKQNVSGKGMLVGTVTENGKSLSFTQDSDKVNITTTASKGSWHTYAIVYSGIPADGLIISTNKFNHRTFFGDNWPNRAHNWLPCVDDPADKATVDFIVTAPDHYQVVSNGLKTEEKVLSGNLKLTHWKENAPIPTKVMVIGVADFAIDHSGDVNGIPVYAYVFPENKEKGFSGYAMAKQILAFYINKIGPYAYEKLANVQSKTIFGGMENAGAIFYKESSVVDAGLEALIAHEIAHQWFGDAASEKSFTHLWLSEGFATYMTNVYLENKYGNEALKKQMADDRLKVLDFEQTYLAPVVDTATKGNYMQLLNANSYSKGAWILHMLRRKLGEKQFWKGIRAYYAKYNGGNANTNDFRHVMEQAGGQCLRSFFKQWLYTPGTPNIEYGWAYNQSKKTLSITIVQVQGTPFEFPIEFLIGGRLKTVQIKDKTTNLTIPVLTKPGAVIPDPDVNLLARFKNVNLTDLTLKTRQNKPRSL